MSGLNYEQVDELSACLDVEASVVKNWYHLAIFLGFKEEATNAMRRDGTGGGHPAHNFLISLQVESMLICY